MNKMIILGSGAAPGVPSVACGWGKCNPNNPKNRRLRTTIYLQSDMTRILIDTSPDLRTQLLSAGIVRLDGVLYTHAHADHLHGIDDLRDINRLLGTSLEVYANTHASEAIRTRFPYLLAERNKPNNVTTRPSLILNTMAHGESFCIGNFSIKPIDLSGHAIPSTGFIINDELVYIADCVEIPQRSLELIPKNPKVLVLPLTSIASQPFHLSLEKLLEYVTLIQPGKTIINHMAVECDYDHVNELTPDTVLPAYDNMTVEF